jgi:hypothetical protein
MLITKWGKAIVSRVLSKALFKKTGIRAGIKINELKACANDDGGTIKLDVEINMTKNELYELEKMIDEIM